MAAKSVAVTTRSIVYRWLTGIPSADVVVVDLRRTLFGGPIVRLIDGIYERSTDNRAASKLGGARDGVDRVREIAATSRTGRAIEAVNDRLLPHADEGR